jgi:signal transduction histidine kinase
MMGWLFGTLSARVVIASAVLTLSVIGFAFAAVYTGAMRNLEAETAQVVEAELRGLVERYRDGGVVELARTLNARAAADETNEAVYLLADAAGAHIAGNVASWPAGAPLDGAWTRVRLTRAEGGESVDVGARAFPVQRTYQLLVGRDMAAQRRFHAAMIDALTLALGVSILLALAAAVMLSRVVMGRIRDIDSTARAFMSGDLDRRVSERRGRDEFDRLAATLNAMFDRIAALMAEMRAVTDSLAHDLRTPLTRLKTNVERAADPDVEPARRDEALEAATAEADRVLASFSTMIDLARAESGVAQSQFERLDLSRAARDVVELHAPLAEESGLALHLHAPAPVEVLGHVQFIGQMLSNLIDNAVKYAGDGKEIRVNVAVEDGEAALIVADRGEGIPEARRAEALKRFGRLDDARRRPGSGLGLSLAAMIARLHGGRLELHDNAPGLRVVVRMPLAPPRREGEAS